MKSDLAIDDDFPADSVWIGAHWLEGCHVKIFQFEEFLRAVATARVVMPESRVRLSAGRNTLTDAQQLECFRAVANSIIVGEKLLTAPNVAPRADRDLYAQLNQPQ